MSKDIKKNFFLLLAAAIPLLYFGCSHQEQKPVKTRIQATPVAVGTIFAVRSVVRAGGGEVLLVPASAIFRRGELTGVFVVGSDNRLSVRWISTGRSMNNDLVVLGGLDKGELVVGTYSPALDEGITVIKRVTAEDQTNE
ncbi:MAG: hypothetical protein HGA59_04530 [Chlorobiaceae bacterium]|nr:hypothetical protein [Chlorobiaceae bacterium]NTV17664.1 hypothetical protein [Chlorobiaceae bacterium]